MSHYIDFFCQKNYWMRDRRPIFSVRVIHELHFSTGYKIYNWADFEKCWIRNVVSSLNQENHRIFDLKCKITQNRLDYIFFKCDFWIRRKILQLEMSVGHHQNHFESLSGEKYIILQAISWIRNRPWREFIRQRWKNVLSSQFFDGLLMLWWISDVYVSFCVKNLSLLASNLIFWIRNEAWTKFVDFGYSSISDPQKSRFRLDLSW